MKRKRVIRGMMGSLMIFGAGVVTTMNLVHLIGFNPAYEASWFKVAFSLGFALLGTIMAIKG